MSEQVAKKHKSEDSNETKLRLRLQTKKDDWNLDVAKIDAALKLLIQDVVAADAITDTRLFLYAKGILANELAAVRQLKFDALLKPDAAQVPDEEKKKLRAGLERLERIVVKGEHGSPLKPTDNAFVNFCKQHIVEWSDASKSYVVFRDDAKLAGKDAYVERVQKSGLCYMHAPIVLQHYVVRKNSDTRVMMLDMAIYLRQHMDSEALYLHIWSDHGGDSAEFLRQILVQQPEPVVTAVETTPTRLVERLKECGPLLVAGVRIDDVFDDKTTMSFRGVRTGKSKGRHAMVLVGHRKEGDLDLFLLQNWWRKKPFVEVTAEYLVSCQANVYVVVTPQFAMGQYPTGNCACIEAENLDAAETFAPEW